MGNLVGYRFKPKDEEIIRLLNKKKIDPDFSVQTINEIDIYNFESCDLPRLSPIQSDELVWYFFCAPYYKYTNSKHANRKTNKGFWKLTGRGCKIYDKHSKEVIGCKRFLTFCEDGNALKKHGAEWVMHEFRSQYNSPHTADFVICRIERKTKNKPKVSTGDAGQSSHHLASNFRDYAGENNFVRVQTQQLPSHLHMTYDFRNHVAENGFLTVEPEQLPSHHLQFDSRNHVAEKTIQGVEDEELANMTSNYRSHFAENIFSTEESQLLPNQFLASDSINHVAEKIFSGVEFQLPSQYLTSDFRNHVAEKTFSRVDCQQLPAHHFNSTSDYGNHVDENNFPMVESQLLPSHHSVSRSRNHVAENNYPQVESQQLQSHYSMSDFRDQVVEHRFSGVRKIMLNKQFQMFGFYILCVRTISRTDVSFPPVLQGEYMLFAQYSDWLNYNSLPADGFSGCNGLHHNSYSAQQSPINPEQGLSSYSDGFSDCNVLNFQFDDKQEDSISQLTVQDQHPLEETGHPISSGFESTISATEFHFMDSSGTDSETLNPCVNLYSPIAAGDYYFYSICNPQLNSGGEDYY